MVKSSLQTAFVTSAVILVLIASGLVGYIAHVSSSKAVEDVAQKLYKEIATRITEHLGRFLALPQSTLEQNARLIADGIVSPHDQVGLQHLFWHQVSVQPALTSLYFGTPDGGLAGAGHAGRHEAFYTTGTEDFGPGTFKKQALDRDGRPAEVQLTLPDYDARARPWFKNALDAPPGVGAWGELYLLFTGHDLALPASRAVRDAGGRVLGVIGADIFTSHISGFLSALHADTPGLTYITDRDGLLIASSTGQAPFRLGPGGRPTRLFARDSASPVIAGTAALDPPVTVGPEGVEAVTDIDGTAHNLRISAFSDARGLDWRITTVVPRAIHTAPIRAANLRSLALSLLASAGMAIAATLLVRRILGPLRLAVAQAEAVGRGDLSASLDGEPRNEIGTLARAFNFMVERLRLAQAEQARQMAALSAAETRFRHLFHGTATAQCTEDLSALVARLDEWRAQGVTDLATWLRSDPARLDDLAGRVHVTEMNDALRHLLDLPDTRDGAAGPGQLTDVRPFFGAGAREAFADKMVAIWEGNTGYRGEARIRTAQGAERDVLLTMPIPATRAGFTIVPVSFVDLTERKTAEATLRDKNAELERSNAELESFAHVTAHDLREPLRTIGSYATLLRRRGKDRLRHDEMEFLDYIHDGAQRMDALIADLLDLARVGRSVRPIEPVALGSVVRTALAALQARLEETGARVSVADDLPVVRGLPDDLERVFLNLISNAIKYRAPERPLQVTIAARPDPDHSAAGISGAMESSLPMWELRVTDNGIGFAPGQGFEDRIFGVFQRLHGRGAQGGGTGIGLAICKKVVEFHGGRISAVSAGEDLGCTIRFTLPAADADGPAAGPAAGPGDDAPGGAPWGGSEAPPSPVS